MSNIRDKTTNEEIKEDIKEEMIEDYEQVNHTLDENIDIALQTSSMGIAGKK